MPRGQPVPITGGVLQWAVQEAGLTEEELAVRLRVAPTSVYDWESGQAAPSRTQFRRLVEVLKRPSALFFLEEPPQESVVQAEFRQALGGVGRRLTPEESRWLRVAKRLQTISGWVMEQTQEEAVELPTFRIQDQAERAAGILRSQLGVTVDAQIRWRDASTALKAWRRVIENQRILVFQLPMGRQSRPGFSLWDEMAPVIAVNTPYNEPARIFSLFHEYAHLLTRTKHRGETYVVPRGSSAHPNDALERWCESFAAAFLLPREAVLDYLSARRTINLDSVRSLANRFKVSLRAAAIRLVELEMADWDLYHDVARNATVSERRKSGGGGRGIKAPYRRLQEFGTRMPSILLRGVNRELLEIHEVLDHVNLSTLQFDQLKQILSASQ